MKEEISEEINEGQIFFGKYKILGKLGEGGYSNVWLARHLKLDCLRAVKVISKREQIYERLLEEAYILKSLNHPGVPHIYDVEEDEDNAYIIEEYCRGDSLKSIVLNQNSLSEIQIVEYLLQICNLIRYLHENGRKILYLDLKPENILVSDGRVILIDFGAAVCVSRIEKMEFCLGTRGFAAPEQYTQSRPDERSDIYGIGKILQYLVYGSVKNDDVNQSRAGDGLINIMNSCIKSDREERYDSVKILEDELNHYYNVISKRRRRYFGVSKRKRVKEVLFDKLTIGIVSTHKGAGATHFSLMLASYFSKILNKRTIVVEEGESKVGENVVVGTFKIVDEGFSGDLEQYQVIIKDYGKLDLKKTSEYMRCDIKFVVTSVCEWKIPYLLEFTERYKTVPGSDKWYYIIPEASDKMLRSMKNYYGMKVIPIGYRVDYSDMSENTKKNILNIIEEWSGS